MEWLLIAVLAWAGAPPATVLQIEVESQELCKAAAERIQLDLSLDAAEIATQGYTDGLPGGVVTTCIEVSN